MLKFTQINLHTEQMHSHFFNTQKKPKANFELKKSKNSC